MYKSFLVFFGGSDVERGCTNDVHTDDKDWCQGRYGCEKCFGSGCNTKNARYSWCLSCKSTDKGDCADVSNSSSYIKKCDGQTYPYSQRGCYVDHKGIPKAVAYFRCGCLVNKIFSYFSLDGNVTRGCIIDLDEQQYGICEHEKTCILCLDDNCNQLDVSSAIKTSMNLLRMFSIVFITHFLQRN